jgi:undecaprenyl diphosphate synthase
MANQDNSTAADTSRPQHIAVVMDGNGRWASKRHLPRAAGHKSGVNATRALVENCARHHIEALTIFAFSSENWNRPVKEVDSLMTLFVKTLAAEMSKLHSQNVRIMFIGDRTRFNKKLQRGIADAEQLTQNNSGLALNIAANYGGRWDIVNACKTLMSRIAAGDLTADAIDENVFAAELSLADLPSPDLFIRTGGEQRISNFLIWQSAYSELYFCDVLWPDFDETELLKALDWYATRQRRFGKTSEQIEVSIDNQQPGSC